jgi:hypothetical protein
VINLRINCAIILVIYNIVYFAVPSEVENLDLKPGSHNISVNWKEPRNNSYCVTHYDIYWIHIEGESSGTKTVYDKVDSFVIEDLDACVDYEVSLRALNEEDMSTGVVTGNTTTETAGNYHVHIILLCL